MRLFRVDFKHNMRPPLLVRGVTRAQITRQMKERYGDLFLRVDYISHEDAEAQFGHFDLFKEGINIKKADMGDVIDANTPPHESISSSSPSSCIFDTTK